MTLALLMACLLGQRPATVLRVVDGDTVVMRLHLGFESVVQGPCRLLGVDAPELPTPEGVASRDWMRARLPVGEEVCFSGDRRDKYGRPLVTIFDDAGNVNQALFQAGRARVMP